MKYEDEIREIIDRTASLTEPIGKIGLEADFAERRGEFDHVRDADNLD